MKEIDWSKAPADATHYNQFAKTWIKHLGSGIYQFLQGDEWAMGFGCMDSRYVERPKPEAWSGEGLPPVGTVCEFTLCRGYVEWVRGLVIGPDGNSHVVLKWLPDKVRPAEYHARNKHEIRPLRTPEQIAAEEREKAVLQMLEDANSWGDLPAAVCLALYKAGYRKVTP